MAREQRRDYDDIPGTFVFDAERSVKGSAHMFLRASGLLPSRGGMRHAVKLLERIRGQIELGCREILAQMRER